MKKYIDFINEKYELPKDRVLANKNAPEYVAITSGNEKDNERTYHVFKKAKYLHSMEEYVKHNRYYWFYPKKIIGDNHVEWTDGGTIGSWNYSPSFKINITHFFDGLNFCIYERIAKNLKKSELELEYPKIEYLY